MESLGWADARRPVPLRNYGFHSWPEWIYRDRRIRVPRLGQTVRPKIKSNFGIWVSAVSDTTGGFVPSLAMIA
jgi:hypothetical protein